MALADLTRRLVLIEQRNHNPKDDTIADLTHRIATLEQIGRFSIPAAEGHPQEELSTLAVKPESALHRTKHFILIATT